MDPSTPFDLSQNTNSSEPPSTPTIYQRPLSNGRVRRYQCTYCWPLRLVAFGSKWELKEHIHSHTGERPFVCDICGKNYGRRSVLWNHKRTHQQIRPLACNICPKTFKWKLSLTSHLQAHEKRSGRDSIDSTNSNNTVRPGPQSGKMGRKLIMKKEENFDDAEYGRQSMPTISTMPTNLSARDLLIFDDEDDQRKFEMMFYESMIDDHAQSELVPLVEKVHTSFDLQKEESFDIVSEGRQPTTQISISIDQVDDVKNNLYVLKPVSPLATTTYDDPNENAEYENTNDVSISFDSVFLDFNCKEIPFSKW